MTEQNKRNLLFFEGSSMRELYDCMEEWQNTNQKRLLSVSIERDGGRFCCIALTNPTEVVITDLYGDQAMVHKTARGNGALYVYNLSG